ncbi:MAG: endonuclease/exonuclease/phosphatase family metal-dependent hydrolase [Verrucomicrobiales bacterium]|jgi:endonuclease/exonuclease/phosphatase family metal-dependent hydrolase
MTFASKIFASPAVALSFLAMLFATPAMADEKLEGVACRSVHLSYRDAPKGLVYYNEVQVEQSAAGTYFCVCGFNHGYFGIQELRRGKKVAIFSIWDPGKQNDPNAVDEGQRVQLRFQGEDVQVKRFGNEGTGGQSFYPLEWTTGERYRFAVSAELIEDGKRTAYTGWIGLPGEAKWKKLVTFATLAKGDVLAGYYSFVEDFRRNRESAEQTRRARFGPAWVQDTEGNWSQLSKARFTADRNPVMNIDGGLTQDGDMFLATGGEIRNETTPLGRAIISEKAEQRPMMPSPLVTGIEPLPALDAASGELRVMSYNIHKGQKTAELAAIIHTINPDIVALQEVDRNTRRSDGRDTLQELAAATGMHSAYGKAMDFDGGAYGVGVLSRFPLGESKVHALPNEGDLEPRVALEIAPQLPAGEMRLFVTHFHAGKERHVRVAQADALARLATEVGTNAVIAGDLNATPESAVLASLKNAGFAEAVTTAAPTIPSADPKRRIDYVLTNAKGWKSKKVFTALDVAPDLPAWKSIIGESSDHQPTVLEIALPKS